MGLRIHLWCAGIYIYRYLLFIFAFLISFFFRARAVSFRKFFNSEMYYVDRVRVMRVYTALKTHLVNLTEWRMFAHSIAEGY